MERSGKCFGVTPETVKEADVAKECEKYKGAGGTPVGNAEYCSNSVRNNLKVSWPIAPCSSWTHG